MRPTSKSTQLVLTTRQQGGRMSISRRRFLNAGTLSVISSALAAQTGLAQRIRIGDRDRYRPDQPGPQTTDPLSLYSKATFAPYLNSVFVLVASDRDVEVALLRIADMPGAPDGECFSLWFCGGTQSMPQDTYTVQHPSLGSFELFVVSTGAYDDGAHGYLA